jgi:uncharacterized membrane protein
MPLLKSVRGACACLKVTTLASYCNTAACCIHCEHYLTDSRITLIITVQALAIVAAMAGAAAAAATSESGSDWLNAVLPAVCIFLDWLKCESYLGDGMKVHREIIHISATAYTCQC